MPIMSGYEACEKILELYESKHDLFKRQKKREMGDIGKLVEEIFTQPLMIACSGLVNEQVKAKAEKHGFQVVIESPLTTEKINSMVIANVK